MVDVNFRVYDLRLTSLSTREPVEPAPSTQQQSIESDECDPCATLGPPRSRAPAMPRMKLSNCLKPPKKPGKVVGVLKASVDCNKDTQTTITRESNVSPKYFYAFFHPPKKMASLSRANHPKYHMGLVRKNLRRGRQQIENDVPCKLVLFCIWEDCRNELEIAHGP